MLLSLLTIFILIVISIPYIFRFVKGDSGDFRSMDIHPKDLPSPPHKQPDPSFISTHFITDKSYSYIECNKSLSPTDSTQGKRDFENGKREECKFLGEGTFNVCGHQLIDPFIFVSDKCNSIDDEYAVNLNHSGNLIMSAQNPEELIEEIQDSTFDKAKLFFFSPLQTDYFLTWLEKYYDMSVLPKHCYNRWMGGLYKRAIIDKKDCAKVCKKMLKFALRYFCSYYLFDSRVNILQLVTAVVDNIDTRELSDDDKKEFRELLDRIIEPLVFHYFKTGWRWDPAYLYDKLTGSPQLSLFKASMIWLARHDDERFDYKNPFEKDEYMHGLNRYSCLLFAMKKVCDAVKNKEPLEYTPRPLRTIYTENNLRLLDFPTLKFHYCEYDYGDPFSRDEIEKNIRQFHEFSSQGIGATARLFSSNDWNIHDIDGIARNFFGLPPFFENNYGNIISSYLSKKEEEFVKCTKDKLFTRKELIHNNGFVKYIEEKHIEVYFNKKEKYKIWVENGPKWNASSSLTCLSDKQIGDMLLWEDASEQYDTDGPTKRTLTFNDVEARNLSKGQAMLLCDTNQFYDKSLIEPLYIMTNNAKQIPAIFEVKSKTIVNQRLKENPSYVYGCWDNAVNRASLLDKDAYTRVFICAKWNLEDIEYKVVWDNVMPVKDQHLTSTGIRSKLRKVLSKETYGPQYPFPASSTIDNWLVKPHSDWNNTI